MKHIYSVTKKRREAILPVFQGIKDRKDYLTEIDKTRIFNDLKRDLRGTIYSLDVHLEGDLKRATVSFLSLGHDLEGIQTAVEETITEDGYRVLSAKEIPEAGDKK